MNLNRTSKASILVLLAVLMASTRFAHFASLPDASWAVFFAGGFYLGGRAGAAAFAALMIEAVLIDFVVIGRLGVSDFCVTPAYAFLVPTHGVLWLAGGWLRRHYRFDGGTLLRLAVAALLSINLAYLISNGAFYWLGGRYLQPNLGEYLQRFAQYYSHFIAVSGAYVVLIALVHVAAASVLPQLRGEIGKHRS